MWLRDAITGAAQAKDFSDLAAKYAPRLRFDMEVRGDKV